MLDRALLGRFARVDEVAQTIACPLSDTACYVTGSVLEVDGGLTAGYLTHRQGADYALRPKTSTYDSRVLTEYLYHRYGQNSL